MRKNVIRRAIVLVVCLAFLGVTASSAFAAKPAKSGIRSTLMKSYSFLVDMFPAIGDLFGKSKTESAGDATGKSVVKPTDTPGSAMPPR